MAEVSYLGLKISDKGLSTSQRKVEVLLATEPPKVTKVLKSFLCAINFYRSFIPCYAKLTTSLLALSSKKVRLVQWSDETLSNFLNLKKALASAPILEFPDCWLIFAHFQYSYLCSYFMSHLLLFLLFLFYSKEPRMCAFILIIMLFLSSNLILV